MRLLTKGETMLETRVFLTAGEYAVIGDDLPIVIDADDENENADELAGWLNRYGK
jgi:uncharacterized protein (UPF0303 family)